MVHFRADCGLLVRFTKALVERAPDGERTPHLGYEKYDSAGDNSSNSSNGTTPQTLRGKHGQVQIDVPRDRTSEFESHSAGATAMCPYCYNDTVIGSASGFLITKEFLEKMNQHWCPESID